MSKQWKTGASKYPIILHLSGKETAFVDYYYKYIWWNSSLKACSICDGSLRSFCPPPSRDLWALQPPRDAHLRDPRLHEAPLPARGDASLLLHERTPTAGRACSPLCPWTPISVERAAPCLQRWWTAARQSYLHHQLSFYWEVLKCFIEYLIKLDQIFSSKHQHY